MENKKLFAEFEPVSQNSWEAAIRQELKGKDFESLIWKTYEGFAVKPFYDREDDIVQPPPFTRLAESWEIIEEIQVEDIENANKKASDLISHGTNSIKFIFLNEFNNSDIKKLLKGIIDKLGSVHFIAEGLESINYFQDFFSDSANFFEIRGSITLKENGGNQTEQMLRIFNSAALLPPEFSCFTISADDELMTKQLSNALFQADSVLQYLSKEFSIDDIAHRILFLFPVSDNYFFEIAKLRAFRFLWIKFIEAFKPQNPRSSSVFVHSEITPDPKSEKQDRFISNTSRVLSAAIGGTDSILIRSEDDFSAMVNRNIQLITKEEAFLGKMKDPSAGSYYIEHLTKLMVEKAWENFSDSRKK